jgi:hypothetical protein
LTPVREHHLFSLTHDVPQNLAVLVHPERDTGAAQIPLSQIHRCHPGDGAASRELLASQVDGRECTLGGQLSLLVVSLRPVQLASLRVVNKSVGQVVHQSEGGESSLDTHILEVLHGEKENGHVAPRLTNQTEVYLSRNRVEDGLIDLLGGRGDLAATGSMTGRRRRGSLVLMACRCLLCMPHILGSI